MPLIDLNAHIQPSEGSEKWWKALNRSIQLPDAQTFISPALTVRIVCGEESFSCWRFLISNPFLTDLLTSPSCCVQEEKVIILDNHVQLLPFFLLKQYLTTGKLKVTNSKVTAETIAQLEEILDWICPNVQLPGKSINVAPAGAPCKISNIESLHSPDSDTEDGYPTMKVESMDGKLNNNIKEQDDLQPSGLKDSKPKKHLMKCHVCGLTKRYLAKHEWLFKRHVLKCQGKVDPEETVVDVEEDDDKDQLVMINCVLCTKMFRNPSTLKNHLTICHYKQEIKNRFVPPGQEQTKLKRCVECTYVTKITASLVMHYGSVHNKLYEVASKEVLESLPSRKRKLCSKSKGSSTGSVKMDESDNSDAFKEEAEFNADDAGY